MNVVLLRFGICELDPQTLELRREGRLIHLRHQPTQVLRLLLERPGQLVTRDEITNSLWPDDLDVDVEQGLNHCVKEIRAALGDRSEAPRYIQTLPRRGYRVLVEVTEARSSTPQAIPAPASSFSASSSSGGMASMPSGARSSHGRVTITLSVARTRDHTVLWSESYDHHAGGVEAIERDLRAALNGSLRHALDAEVLRPVEDEIEIGAESHLSRRGFE